MKTYEMHTIVVTENIEGSMVVTSLQQMYDKGLMSKLTPNEFNSIHDVIFGHAIVVHLIGYSEFKVSGIDSLNLNLKGSDTFTIMSNMERSKVLKNFSHPNYRNEWYIHLA